MKIRAVAIAVLCSILMSIIYSCKEGCKDSKALNYVSNANNENGDCIYCKDTTIYQATSAYFFDMISVGNKHYGQVIMRADINKTYYMVTGNGCQAAGHIAKSSDSLMIKIVNLTSDTIQTSFRLGHFLTPNSTDFTISNTAFYANNFLFLLPHDSAYTFLPTILTKDINIIAGSWESNFNTLIYK